MNGKQLKEALKELSLSQVAFARVMGRDQATVSLWCNDKMEVPAYVISYISVARQVKGAKSALANPV